MLKLAQNSLRSGNLKEINLYCQLSPDEINNCHVTSACCKNLNNISQGIITLHGQSFQPPNYIGLESQCNSRS